MKLTGQWIGGFSGTPGGFGTLSIEADRPDRAIACLIQPNPLPGTRIEFVVNRSGESVEIESSKTLAWDQEKQTLVDPDDFVRRNPDTVHFSKTITAKLNVDHHLITGSWSGDENMKGEFRLENTIRKGVLPADHTFEWDEFRRYVNRDLGSSGGFLFRGQEDSRWPLQSSLHRLNRYDLARYEIEVFPELLLRINSVSAEPYDLRHPDHFGAVLSLAQHHGFPTPLLDWTRSPYIAAFFAFERQQDQSLQNGHARIFVLTNEWRRDSLQYAHFGHPSPVVAVREFAARNNPRHMPQQSVHTYVNVEDVLGWVRLVEGLNKKKYMTVIDIPLAQRNVVLKELEFMGVNAASMFPGIDGICRTLKQRHYGC